MGIEGIGYLSFVLFAFRVTQDFNQVQGENDRLPIRETPVLELDKIYLGIA